MSGVELELPFLGSDLNIWLLGTPLLYPFGTLFKILELGDKIEGHVIAGGNPCIEMVYKV